MFRAIRTALWEALRPPEVSSVLRVEIYGAERDLLNAVNVLEHAQSQVDYKRARLARLRAMLEASNGDRCISDALPKDSTPTLRAIQSDPTALPRSVRGS